MGENGTVVAGGPSHDFGVGCVWPTNCTPVRSLDTYPRKNLDPRGAEVHVDNKSHHSNGFHRGFPFFGSPGRIGERGPYVLNGEVRIEGENLGNLGPRRQQARDGSDRDASPPNARFSPHDLRGHGNSVDVREGNHGSNIGFLWVMSNRAELNPVKTSQEINTLSGGRGRVL